MLKSDVLYLWIVICFTIPYISFAFFSAPYWLMIPALVGILLFILRIIRGDD